MNGVTCTPAGVPAGVRLPGGNGSLAVVPLPAEQYQKLRQGCDLFNRGEFFECHEALETAWLKTAGEQKTFFQGLIQIAVSFYHLRHENFVGAERLLRAGIKKLSSIPADVLAVESTGLVRELETLLARLESKSAGKDHPAPEFHLLVSAPSQME